MESRECSTIEFIAAFRKLNEIVNFIQCYNIRHVHAKMKGKIYINFQSRDEYATIRKKINLVTNLEKRQFNNFLP